MGQATKDDVAFYINPVNEGLVFQSKQIEAYLKQIAIEPKRHHFLPCDNIKTLSALVRNLVLCYEQKGNNSKAKQMSELLLHTGRELVTSCKLQESYSVTHNFITNQLF